MADDPKSSEPTTPPVAAGDKPAGTAPGEPIKTEVSRTDSPGAGASAAPVGPVAGAAFGTCASPAAAGGFAAGAGLGAGGFGAAAPADAAGAGSAGFSGSSDI